MNANPKLLYHYTNQMGLLGILDSAILRCTQIHYLNDSTEFWHAYEIAKRILVRENSLSLDEKISGKLMALKEEISSLVATGTCITSFTESQDMLSQWRGYVGNQPGFALGFDFDALKQIAEKASSELHPCAYDGEEQEKAVLDLVRETMAKEFNTSLGYWDPDRANTFVFLKMGGSFGTDLMKLAPLHKNEAFAEEKEWRIVYTPRPKKHTVKYRPGASTLIPFVEIDLLQNGLLSCIKEIVVGPCAHPELAKTAVEGLITSTVLFGQRPRVLTSRAPLRYW